MKIANNNLFVCLLGVVFLSIGLFSAPAAFAGAGDNVTGFAWAGNQGPNDAIGWISFNGTDCGTCSGLSCASNGLNGCPTPAGTSYKDYGVNIATDGTGGKISGYAWSNSVGWISFNSDVNGACPAGFPDCQARVDSTGKITGWARAIAACQDSLWDSVNKKCTGSGAGNTAGGWDGWIKLSGTTQDGHSYGWTIDVSGYFHGYAFGSTNSGDSITQGVIGWISVNCAEGKSDASSICATSPYKVHTSFSAAPVPPVAEMECGGDCPGGTCSATTWEAYGRPGNCPRCDFRISNKSTGNVHCAYWQLLIGGVEKYSYSTSGTSTISLGIAFGNDITPTEYTVRLTVSDVNSAKCATGSNSTEHLIKIKRELVAGYKCAFNNTATTTWQDCTSATGKVAFAKKIVKGEKVYVKDNSVPSEDATAITSDSWKFTVDGGTPSEPTGSVASFTAGTTNIIELTAYDDCPPTPAGSRHNCAASVTLGSTRTLPKWQEVSPVSMIWNYLVANISKIFVTLRG